ncbi:MAG: DUF3536 domain-containing protein [Deltaproteobacteria bacterium]|nr:DUF3536 domain-containing protein [Deltaproteobacteria bacterium]
MSRKVCIHGHFYQPPREDPWLGRIFSEASAAPMRHWNERITCESYAPLAWARRLSNSGGITDLVNCYEWISFNIGPTLLHWLEREAPEVLERIIEADAVSLRRWGHGNAMAQIYHHVIMPLASDLDKKLEVRWALDDFERRFGRVAEGMWLSECAVDTASLEALAAEGIRFVSLSPYQAAAVAAPGQEFAPVSGALDISRPYSLELPSGREMAVFFYHGSLAQAVAFEGLLSDGERFWQHLRRAAERDCTEGGILSMATDGETYGHHSKFGEMSLAYVLEQGRQGRDGLELTNFATYLEQNPPTWRARLLEPSSWSCAHGVERWRSDCGCSDGGHSGWNQRWRAPLRQAMNEVKTALDAHFFTAGKAVFKDPQAALLEFGQVLADHSKSAEFAARHLLEADGKTAHRLLRMQENGLAAFASCAWFFDDISRIEPVKALSFALRAMEFCRLTGGPDLQERVEKILSAAFSNKPEEGSGRDVFIRRVLPSRQDEASLCLFSYLHAYCDDLLPENCHGEVSMDYPALRVRLDGIECGPSPEAGKASGQFADQVSGRAVISTPEAATGIECAWSGLLPHRWAQEQGTPPVLLGRAQLMAERTGEQTGEGASRRSSLGLARHLHDFLNIRLVRRAARLGATERSLALAHCVSNLQKFEEGQVTWHSEECWAELLPYLPLACFYLGSTSFCRDTASGSVFGSGQVREEHTPIAENSPSLSDDKSRHYQVGDASFCHDTASGDYSDNLDQAAAIMRGLGASGPVKARAAALLEEEVLRLLAARSLDDAGLAAAVRRAVRVLPEMNWWKVQNYLWDEGLCKEGYPGTASVVGFELER